MGYDDRLPTVFRYREFRFFFYSKGTPREPIHIHVERATAKENSGCILKREWPRITATSLALCANCWKLSKTIRVVSKEHGMTTSVSATAAPTNVRFDDDSIGSTSATDEPSASPSPGFPASSVPHRSSATSSASAAADSTGKPSTKTSPSPASSPVNPTRLPLSSLTKFAAYR